MGNVEGAQKNLSEIGDGGRRDGRLKIPCL